MEYHGSGRGSYSRLNLLIGASVLLISANAHLARASRNPPRSWDSTRNATNPLVYKRLRFEDDALYILNRYQKYLATDEHEVKFLTHQSELSDGTDGQTTRAAEFSFYQNDHVESAGLTYDDLVFEALDASFLAKLKPYYLQTYDDKDELAKSSDKRLVSRSRCDRELNYLLDQVRLVELARQDSRAETGVALSSSLNAEVVALLDSFGMEQQSLLFGNFYWAGNWRQCAKRRLFSADRNRPENSIDFRSRYCVASLRSKRWHKLVGQRVRELDAVNYFRKDEQRNNYERSHRLQVGVCVPESCDSQLLHHRPLDIHKLAVHKLSAPMRNYDLVDFFCLPDETSELRKFDTSALLFFALMALWLATTVWVTVVDMMARRKARCQTEQEHQVKALTDSTTLGKLVDCMSLLKNLDRVFETRSCQPKPTRGAADSAPAEAKVDPLQFLNCAKVVATVSIALCHVAMLLVHMNKYTLDNDRVNSVFAHYQYSAIFFVDWFFVIAGFLAAYSVFSRRLVERHTPWSWTGTIIHRYFRLAPIFVLLLWFNKSVFMQLGQGPFWDYGTHNNTARSNCRRESLLVPLTLTSNWNPIYDECIGVSWHISCDFQFFLITPFLFTLLHKSPLWGWVAGGAGVAMTVLGRAYRFWSDPHVEHLSLLRPNLELYMRTNWDSYDTYLYPQYRLSAYLLGILAGHYIHMVRSGQWHSVLSAEQRATATRTGSASKNRSWTSCCNVFVYYAFHLNSWLIMLSIAFSSWIMLYYFPQSQERYAEYYIPVLYGSSHTMAALGFTTFLVSMALGEFSALRHIMSLPFWSVLARFNYIVYIGQIELIHWLLGSRDELLPLSTVETVNLSMSLLFACYFVAAIMTPLLEVPIGLLERRFIAPIFAAPPLQQVSPNPSNPGVRPDSLQREPVRWTPLAPAGNSAIPSIQTYELGQVASGEHTHLMNGSAKFVDFRK